MIEEQPERITEQCASTLDAELRRLRWAKRLDETVLADFIATARVKHFEANSVALDVGQAVTDVLFVVTGSFRVTLFDQLGAQKYRGNVGPGGAIGLLAIACQQSSLIKVEALEPSTVVKLSFDELLELGTRCKAFQRAMLELTSELFVRVSAASRKLSNPGTVAVVHFSERTVSLTTQLANRLNSLGEQPSVLSDRPCAGLASDIAFEKLIDDGACISPVKRRETIKSWASRGRLILNLTTGIVGNELVDFLNYAETILWCVSEDDASMALEWMEKLQRLVPWVRDKICLVWILKSQQVAPYVPQLTQLVHRDFKLSLHGTGPEAGTQLKSGLERIVHYLRGVQIGLALGGGAARGMAHLGVLRALEDQGIVVDKLAGTSAGAMTGTIYALGLAPQFATDCFKRDLLPSWLFRQLPAGGYWYLLHKYRRGLFGPMLRRYLKDYRLEQLPIPMTTVAVDLVDGEPHIATVGDAAQSVLESINLPPLSLPLFEQQKAIVDGGLLNNVPANVLVSQGCNFVIASSVTAKLDRDFMEIRKLGRPRRSLFFSSIQVIMRQSLVQSYSMNAIGVSPADFVLTPDVTAFDISEFTRADEMAEIGYRHTLQQASELASKLRTLDPPLFGSKP